MKLSVIIPTYKPNYYLFQCLDSLCKQTFPFKDFEVIIILNGDKFPYELEINRYKNKSPLNINLIFTPIKGVSNARNVGIDNIKSEYIVFIDDDDKVSNNYLEKLYNLVSKDTVIVTNYSNFSNTLDKLDKDYVAKCFDKCKKLNSYNLLKYRCFMSNVTGKIIPKEIIKQTRFDNRLQISEDAIFMFNISKNIKKILLTEENVIYYRRVRQNSASKKSMYVIQNFSILIKQLYILLNIYFKNPTQYNFLFFSTRLVAVFIPFIKRF